MRFTVGGEEYDLTKERVISAMRGVPSEPIQKYLVEIGETVFPPKQVFATVTGRVRTSFTTMEAQRVLRRLGFVCRAAGRLDDGTPAWVEPRGEDDGDSAGVEARVTALEAALATAQAAIGGLHARVSELEEAR
jgi:hypothetical protein